MKLKKFLVLTVLLTVSYSLSAMSADSIRSLDKLPSSVAEVTAENPKDRNVKFRFDTRIDGMYNTYGQRVDVPESMQKDQYGFTGRYLKLLLYGNITDKLSYSFRYRMNTLHVNSIQFFSTVDWLNLTYDINDNFSIAGGKQMIYMGGWEYDYAPVDVHIPSNFWNNTPSVFAFGVSGCFRTNDKNHSLYLQVTNSQFATTTLSNMFSYSLSWYGNIDFWKTIYSVNFFEYEKDKFINYIVLGNKFDFGKVDFYVDYMNRAGSLDKFFSNFSLISRVNYNLNDKITVFAKGGYDQNLSQVATTSLENTYDRVVLPGTQYAYYGAGIEYTPIVTRKHALRLHAFWYGTNDEYMPQSVNIGIKWQMNVIE